MSTHAKARQLTLANISLRNELIWFNPSTQSLDQPKISISITPIRLTISWLRAKPREYAGNFKAHL